MRYLLYVKSSMALEKTIRYVMLKNQCFMRNDQIATFVLLWHGASWYSIDAHHED